MEINLMSKKKCEVCGIMAGVEDADLPTLTFNFLECSPAVCEVCVARAFGIVATWNESTRKFVIGEK